MLPFREELFGPIFSLTKFKHPDEGVALMNASDYGLGATIISKDTSLASLLAKKIESGSVTINECMRSDSRMPSGGCKDSGYGRECGSFGYLEFANIKSTYLSKL